MSVPERYAPPGQLSKRDQRTQLRMLTSSRRAYKQQRYVTRKRLPSFHNRPSKHITNARKMYHVEDIVPSTALARATGCSKSALQQIVKKGEGAYYSSGSRPNQTAQSWGFARLASAITSGKAAAVDYHILEQGCDPTKKALILAKKAKANQHTWRKTRKIPILR